MDCGRFLFFIEWSDRIFGNCMEKITKNEKLVAPFDRGKSLDLLFFKKMI